MYHELDVHINEHAWIRVEVFFLLLWMHVLKGVQYVYMGAPRRAHQTKE
jgi:hypothetical protein